MLQQYAILDMRVLVYTNLNEKNVHTCVTEKNLLNFFPIV